MKDPKVIQTLKKRIDMYSKFLQEAVDVYVTYVEVDSLEHLQEKAPHLFFPIVYHGNITEAWDLLNDFQKSLAPDLQPKELTFDLTDLEKE
jgi:hypothetical protein